MRIVVEGKKLIRAHEARVFELVSDLGQHLRWVSGITYISARGPMRPGMSYESVSVSMGNEMSGRHLVKQVVPTRLVEIDNVTGPLESTIQYILQDAPEGTLVTCMFWIHSDHPVFGLAMPLVEMLAQARIESDLDNLKVFAESGV